MSSAPFDDLPAQTGPKSLATIPTRVEEVMTRQVLTLSPHDSFREAITLIARHRFRHLLVVGAEKELAGVISDRDLLRFMLREPQWEVATVAEAMKPDPVTARSETLLSTAAAEMLNHRINCLPVTDDDGRVCGILTSTDLLRVFQQVQEWIEKGAWVK